MRCDVLIFLLACLPKPPPEPLFPPIKRYTPKAQHEPVPQPDDCTSADVHLGEPLPWAPSGVATCDGQLVSPSLALELIQARDTLPPVLAALHACEDLADARTTVYEDRLTDERAAREWAERDARVQRLAVPVALVGGVVLGGAAAIGALAASEGVVGR